MQIQSQFRRYKGDMQPRVAYASSFIIAEKYINNTIGLGIPSPLDKSPEFAEQLDTIITKLQDLKELNYDHETSFIALEDKINGTVKKELRNERSKIFHALKAHEVHLGESIEKLSCGLQDHFSTYNEAGSDFSKKMDTVFAELQDLRSQQTSALIVLEKTLQSALKDELQQELSKVVHAIQLSQQQLCRMIESISKVSLKKLRSDLTAPEAGTDASEANQFPADISQWSEVHVLHWLEVTIALPQYCNRFKDGAVDGNGLMTQITGEVLASLFGIHDEQHRSQILSGIQDLKQCQEEFLLQQEHEVAQNGRAKPEKLVKGVGRKGKSRKKSGEKSKSKSNSKKILIVEHAKSSNNVSRSGRQSLRPEVGVPRGCHYDQTQVHVRIIDKFAESSEAANFEEVTDMQECDQSALHTAAQSPLHTAAQSPDKHLQKSDLAVMSVPRTLSPDDILVLIRHRMFEASSHLLKRHVVSRSDGQLTGSDPGYPSGSPTIYDVKTFDVTNNTTVDRTSLVFNALVNQPVATASSSKGDKKVTSQRPFMTSKLTRLKLQEGLAPVLRLRLDWPQFDALWAHIGSSDMDLHRFTAVFGDVHDREGIDASMCTGGTDMNILVDCLYSLCDHFRRLGLIETISGFWSTGRPCDQCRSSRGSIGGEVPIAAFCNMLQLATGDQARVDNRQLLRALTVAAMDADTSNSRGGSTGMGKDTGGGCSRGGSTGMGKDTGGGNLVAICVDDVCNFAYRVWKAQVHALAILIGETAEKDLTDSDVTIALLSKERCDIKAAIKRTFAREWRDRLELSRLSGLSPGPLTTLLLRIGLESSASPSLLRLHDIALYNADYLRSPPRHYMASRKADSLHSPRHSLLSPVNAVPSSTSFRTSVVPCSTSLRASVVAGHNSAVAGTYSPTAQSKCSQRLTAGMSRLHRTTASMPELYRTSNTAPWRPGVVRPNGTHGENGTYDDAADGAVGRRTEAHIGNSGMLSPESRLRRRLNVIRSASGSLRGSTAPMHQFQKL